MSRVSVDGCCQSDASNYIPHWIHNLIIHSNFDTLFSHLQTMVETMRMHQAVIIDFSFAGWLSESEQWILTPNGIKENFFIPFISFVDLNRENKKHMCVEWQNVIFCLSNFTLLDDNVSSSLPQIIMSVVKCWCKFLLHSYIISHASHTAFAVQSCCQQVITFTFLHPSNGWNNLN